LIDHLIAKYSEPFDRSKGSGPLDLRDRLRELNWSKVGIVRSGHGLLEALDEVEAIFAEARNVRVPGNRVYNMVWNDWISLLNMLDISRLVIHSALLRKESRGAHFREDFPQQDDRNGLFNLCLKQAEDGRPRFDKRPVDLKYMKP
jgi:succinate dehydrogenase/fumarate reductase flavoprotein subunit